MKNNLIDTGTRMININLFNAMYDKLEARDELLGRRDFTIHVLNESPSGNNFIYCNVNPATGENESKSFTLRVNGCSHTLELIQELKVGCDYKILSWKLDNKSYSWVAATRMNKFQQQLDY